MCPRSRDTSRNSQNNENETLNWRKLTTTLIFRYVHDLRVASPDHFAGFGTSEVSDDFVERQTIDQG